MPWEIKVQSDNDVPSVNTGSNACHLAEHSQELRFGGVIYVSLLG